MRARAFIFAGGGSGGHIYPGLAVAESLRRLDPNATIRFVCSDKAIDARILRAAGEDFVPIPARALSAQPARLARLMLNWGTCVRAARAAIRDARRIGEVRVVTLGGYVAAPVVQAARVEGAPVTLINLDAVPGRANRFLARRADERLTTVPLVRPGWTRIPPIVRRAAVAPGDASTCRARLGLDRSLPTLFVTGASQGARSINLAMVELLTTDPGLLAGWQVLHQTGADDNDAYARAYRDAGVPAVVVESIEEMGSAWGAADLAISRCGAGNVAEVWANAVPTVFLPYPYHRDDHQRLNAAPLVEAGGAFVVTDAREGPATAAAVRPVLARLIRDSGTRAACRTALRALGPADGADAVASRLVADRGERTEHASTLTKAELPAP